MNGALHADNPATAEPGNLNKVLKSIARIAGHDHLVLVLSDFDGIDEATERHLAGIAAHNDLILGLVHDPSARSIGKQPKAVLGDGTQQAEVDFGRAEIAEAVRRLSSARLDAILDWQTRINLSVLPLSAGEETLPQLRRLMGAGAHLCGGSDERDQSLPGTQPAGSARAYARAGAAGTGFLAAADGWLVGRPCLAGRPHPSRPPASG